MYEPRYFPHGFVRARDIAGEDFQWREFASVSEHPANTTAMMLCGRGKDETAGWESVAGRREVETVFYFQAHDRHLQALAGMSWLKVLGLLQPKSADLTAVSSLENLEALFIEDATKLETLEFARPLKSLRALGVFDAKRLNDIAALRELTGLEELALQRGIWNAMKLRSLKPIATLTGLKCLRLTAESEDRSLEPLRQLTALEDLDLNLLYPMEEYARLAAFLPEDICPVFEEPYEKIDGLCRRNEAHTTILPAGTLKRWCHDCNPQKLEEYLAEYDRIRDTASSRSAWV